VVEVADAAGMHTGVSLRAGKRVRYTVFTPRLLTDQLKLLMLYTEA